MGDFSGREPCPYRILDDIGGAYAMGAVGGSIGHFVKGWRNAPKNQGFSGAIEQVKVRAPVVGGNFAVWGGLFACFDCSLVAVRHKEDPWNSILAGAATGGVLAATWVPEWLHQHHLFGMEVGVLLFAAVAVAPTLSAVAAVVFLVWYKCLRPKPRKKRKKTKKLED